MKPSLSEEEEIQASRCSVANLFNNANFRNYNNNERNEHTTRDI